MITLTRVMNCALAIAVAMTFASAAPAETLKASHQWPGGKGDVRDEMVQIIAREINKAQRIQLARKALP